MQRPGTNAIIQDVMLWLRSHGVRRSALVTDNPMLLLQVKRLATDWIEHGTEPPVGEEGPY